MKTRFLKSLLIITTLLLSFSLGIVSAQDHGDAEEEDHASHSSSMETHLPTVGPDVTIRFAATVGDSPAACGIIYEGLGLEGAPVILNDYRFFVHNVRLINADGVEVPVELAQDGLWQYANVALLDFEDGTSTCSETGTSETNTKIVGSVPADHYNGIVFELGLPFELNHLDTTTAPAPLNIPAMWWNWRFGYKFARIDLQTPTSQTPQWFIHLGSTGCEAPDSNTAPEEPCSHRNVASVRLEGFDPLRNFVVADLESLLASVAIEESTPMPPGCMSGTDDPDCIGLFPAFGLDLETGLTSETATQSFFQVQ